MQETDDKLELIRILDERIAELEEQTDEKDTTEMLDVEMVSYWIFSKASKLKKTRFIDKDQDTRQKDRKADQEVRIIEYKSYKIGCK